VGPDEVAMWITFCKMVTDFDDLKTKATACGMMEKIEE
jgi:hypothetical protein